MNSIRSHSLRCSLTSSCVAKSTLCQTSSCSSIVFSRQYFNTEKTSSGFHATKPNYTATRCPSSIAAAPATDSVHYESVQTFRSRTRIPTREILEPAIHDVFHSGTGTWQYVVADPANSVAAIIDPVLDFDPASCAISTESADMLLSFIAKKGYTVKHILETHAHADHLTAASYLQQRLLQQTGTRPPIGIGRRIAQVQSLFGNKYGIVEDEYENVFDKLFDDDEVFQVGGLRATAIHLPGHTPDHMGYKIGSNVFCGDSLFMADLGTARCDFPGGNAGDLFRSAAKLLSMPEDVRIWTGHDYPPEARKTPRSWMSVKVHRERNAHVMAGTTEQEFVTMRTTRDKTLKAPRLLHQSLQINIRAGRLPRATPAGGALLHLPLSVNENIKSCM